MSVNNYTDYLATYGASGAYKSQASFSVESFKSSASYLEITGDLSGSKYARGADSVDLSGEVQDMLDRIRSLDVFSCIFPNNDPRQKTKSLGEVENDFMSDFYDFAGAFGKMSGMLGMTGSDSVTMGLDGKGGMTFDSSSSEYANAFAGAFGNETMTARFAVMAARASLADAGYTVDGFQQAYAQDPVRAIEDNIGALKERLLGFRTVGSGANMQYGFVREGEIEYSKVTAGYGTEEVA